MIVLILEAPLTFGLDKSNPLILVIAGDPFGRKGANPCPASTNGALSPSF